MQRWLKAPHSQAVTMLTTGSFSGRQDVLQWSSYMMMNRRSGMRTIGIVPGGIVAGGIAAGVCGGILMMGMVAFAGDAEKGKAVYEKHCLMCHGAAGKGDGPAGGMMNPKPADFTSPASKKKSEAELLQVIESGRPGTPMAGWKGTLSPDQIQDVLAYVRSLGK
jgi:mono/diheme cytochrome c family protein